MNTRSDTRQPHSKAADCHWLLDCCNPSSTLVVPERFQRCMLVRDPHNRHAYATPTIESQSMQTLPLIIRRAIEVSTRSAAACGKVQKIPLAYLYKLRYMLINAPCSHAADRAGSSSRGPGQPRPATGGADTQDLYGNSLIQAAGCGTCSPLYAAHGQAVRCCLLAARLRSVPPNCCRGHGRDQPRD